jgi:hypothetical protein
MSISFFLILDYISYWFLFAPLLFFPLPSFCSQALTTDCKPAEEGLLDAAAQFYLSMVISSFSSFRSRLLSSCLGLSVSLSWLFDCYLSWTTFLAHYECSLMLFATVSLSVLD